MDGVLGSLLIVVVVLHAIWACVGNSTSMRLRHTLNAILFVFGFMQLRVGMLLDSFVIVILASGLLFLAGIFVWRTFKASDIEGGVIILNNDRRIEIEPD